MHIKLVKDTTTIYHLRFTKIVFNCASNQHQDVKNRTRQKNSGTCAVFVIIVILIKADGRRSGTEAESMTVKSRIRNQK